MEDTFSQENNPWVNLSTVTNFDKGVDSCSTKCISDSIVSTSSNKMVKKVSSSSILIGSLINQLCSLLEKDPGQSKKLYLLLCDTMHKMKLIDPSYKAIGFEFIQERYLDAICQLIRVARATIARDNPVAIERPFITYVSLYQDQFHETGFIAVGGFGSVFRAVHKLDEVEYAIKKIIVKPGKVKTIMNYLEEVKTLAKLNHTNIVPYKQAWIEPMSTACMMQLPSTCKSQSNEILESEIYCNKKSSQKSYKSKSRRHFGAKVSQNTFCDSEESSSKRVTVVTSESNSDIVSFRENSNFISDSKHNHNIEVIHSRSSTEESTSSDESFENHRICQYSTQINQYTILYIQMALCEKTLRQWLDERIEPTSLLLVTNIAAQILCGLDYIHSLKVVHHDIKPSNIFISTSGKLEVQLGDFGLACPLQRDSHEAIVGTCMYAAPEQLQGECNPKSDIYSLGIVLLELLIPMQTSMECITIVKTLQNGGITKNLLDSDLKWINIITQLIQKNPTKRPSTSELLEELKMDKDLTISKLQDENHQLKQKNSFLESENKQKDQTIKNQNFIIEELQAELAKLKR